MAITVISYSNAALPRNWHPLWIDRHSRVKTHYLHGRDAGHFGRWLGARSEVIYTIMSDEQQRQRPKGPRPFGLQRKSSPGSSKGSTVLPIRFSPFSCPASDFGCNAARGNNGF
jgi:hypothetical protein